MISTMLIVIVLFLVYITAIITPVTKELVIPIPIVGHTSATVFTTHISLCCHIKQHKLPAIS
ncbi:MAG: hypothetical protein AAF617_05720 [Bacteroidota bacterium]